MVCLYLYVLAHSLEVLAVEVGATGTSKRNKLENICALVLPENM